MQPRGGVPRVKQVVRERDPVARGDGQDLVLDVAEECGVCEAVGRARKELGGVEGPLVLVVTVAEEECASGVRSWTSEPNMLPLIGVSVFSLLHERACGS